MRQPVNTSAWTLFGLLISFSLTACYYDNEEDLYQFITEPPCDTLQVSYRQQVLPLLQTSCYSCHDATVRSGNIDLETFSKLQTVALNGKLYGSLAHLPGFSPMPKNDNAFPECEVAQINSWINDGALEN